MKRSERVPARILLAVSASLAALGCGSDVTEVRRCVDQNGFVLPDGYCNSGYYYGGGYYFYGGRRIYGHPGYVYGGGGSFAPGGIASGFRRTPTEGATIRTPSGSTIGTYSNGSISRGGFGGGGGSFGG